MIEAIKRLLRRQPKIVETRSSKDREDLTEFERNLIIQSGGRCCDCGSEYYEGPSGGMSTNYYCSNADCGSRVNLTPYCGQLIFAERISDRSPNAKVA